MADNLELKACPFCGGTANVSSYRSCDCCGKAYNGAVTCGQCRQGVDHYDSDAEAIAAWNIRTPTPPAGDVVLAAGVRGILHKHGGPVATGDWLVRAANEIADYATAALATGSGERMREAGKRLVVALDAHDPLHDVQPALEAFRAALNEQEG